MERAREMKVRVYPTGPVGLPIAGYVAEVGEPLLGEGWAVFADSSPSEPTKRKAMAALRERLERRLLKTLEAIDAVDPCACGGTVHRRGLCARCYADPDQRAKAPRERAPAGEAMIMAPWRVPPELVARVNARAKRDGVEPAAWFRAALDHALSGEKP